MCHSDVLVPIASTVIGMSFGYDTYVARYHHIQAAFHIPELSRPRNASLPDVVAFCDRSIRTQSVRETTQLFVESS